MRCKTHGKFFTLYPCGHVRYGRRAVAPVTLDGGPAGSTPDAFADTVFRAALDASREKPWARESDGADDPGWPSMGRDLQTAVSWVGVAPELEEKEREARAADLDVDLLPLHEGARAIEEAPGYRSRGRAVMTVLGELPRGRPLLEHLLRAGHAAGLLGEPLFPVRPGGPLRSLARERRPPEALSGSRDPPRKRDVPSSRRGP